ncbi:hypothetical protein BWQ96_01466 [Gracilariopsis chorda]|uniref:Uncharacterized protein n=1 Tax=Gracilariopsis chorda TaxID=448386 RepID=A0A2V3J2L3_9FLOR|nr:hypothetical protein BWQ96_01466 [Gracilariopsis chorda]|eukprot:PXF48614.1 hypothetical protein BWQ96_01466 [Gracilariopsis chorda]
MIKTVRNLLSRSPDDSSDDDSIDWENPLAFYNIASRTINHEKNIEKGLHSEVAFYLYGALCFSLVPLTTYFMAPNPRFVKWYSANLAVKGSERFFDIAIPVLSVLCVSLVVMSVTSRTGDIELVLRNAIALLVWLFYFANLSNDILKDVALKSDIVRPDDSGALHLQPGYEQCQPFPTDLLNPTIVHELVLFVVVYIYFAFARFRQLMQIRNRRTILSNWSDLLRNVALNNGTAIIEEQDF